MPKINGLSNYFDAHSRGKNQLFKSIKILVSPKLAIQIMTLNISMRGSKLSSYDNHKVGEKDTHAEHYN